MQRRRSILLVEDDQVDCMTIKRALEEVKIKNRLDMVSNGEEALAYLLSADNDLPGLILLDLNMPRMNGIEFFKNRKNPCGFEKGAGGGSDHLQD